MAYAQLPKTFCLGNEIIIDSQQMSINSNEATKMSQKHLKQHLEVARKCNIISCHTNTAILTIESMTLRNKKLFHLRALPKLLSLVNIHKHNIYEDLTVVLITLKLQDITRKNIKSSSLPIEMNPLSKA